MANNLYLGISLNYNRVTASYIYRDICDIVRFDGKPYLKVLFNQQFDIKNFVKFLGKEIRGYVKNNIPESFDISKTVVSLPCDLENSCDEVNNAIFYDLIDEMINSDLFGKSVQKVYAPISASIGVSNILKSLVVEKSWPLSLLFLNLEEKNFDIYLTQLNENKIETLIDHKENVTFKESKIDTLTHIIESCLLKHPNLPETVDVALMTGDLFIFKEKIDKDFIKKIEKYPFLKNTIFLNLLDSIELASIFGVLSYGSAVIAKNPELIKSRLGFNFYIRLYEEMKDERYFKQAKRYENLPNLLVSNDGRCVFYDFLIFGKETELVDDGINLVFDDLLKKIFDDENIFIDFQKQTDFIIEKRMSRNIKRIDWDIYDEKFKEGLNKINLSFTLSKKGEINAVLLKDGEKILEKIIF